LELLDAFFSSSIGAVSIVLAAEAALADAVSPLKLTEV